MKNPKIHLRIAALICALAALFSVFAICASAETRAEGETVRVGYMLLENFQEGGEGEIKSGYGYEYLQAVRNYTGWKYEYVYGTWDELIGKLERGEIDIISHVARTPKRENTMLFSMSLNLKNHTTCLPAERIRSFPQVTIQHLTERMSVSSRAISAASFSPNGARSRV